MDLSGSACRVHTKTANVGGNFHGQSGRVIKGNTLSRRKVLCGNPVRSVQVAASSGERSRLHRIAMWSFFDRAEDRLHL